MADMTSYEPIININELSYDEYCILAFGKDVDELREESKSLKKDRKENKL